MLQSMALLYVPVEFGINHAYIANVLCVNRDKPQLHCDGKCFLKKEINKAAEQQQEQKNTTSFNSLTLYIIQPFAQHLYPAVLQPVSKLYIAYTSAGHLKPTEHPPTL